MPDRVALVIGPTGATGGPIAAALARRSGWRVYGMSRNAPSGEVPFTYIKADLTDPESCRRALATIDPVTHAFFAARAVSGRRGRRCRGQPRHADRDAGCACHTI